MRYLIFILLFQISFSFKAYSQKNSEVNIIDLAQMLELIEDKDDKLHVINFWATWCKPCIAELPYFTKAAKDFPEVKFSFISLDFADQVKKVEKFVKKKEMDQNDLYLIDNIDYNSWIDKVSPKWSGAIPFTLIVKDSKKYVYEGQFKEGELHSLIQDKLK